MTNTKQIIAVTKEEDIGLRLDIFISQLKQVSSRSLSQKIIKNKFVMQKKNKQILKASYLIKAKDIFIINIPLQNKENLKPWDAELDIIYEDTELAVVNKASGIAVHPSIGHRQKTLVNLLLHHCHSLSMGLDEERPGIVHRIDLHTSGLLVIAKNNESHQFLAQQFKEKRAHRKYWALVFGVPEPKQASILSYLRRDPRDRKKFASTTKNTKKQLAVIASDSHLLTSVVNSKKEEAKKKPEKKTAAKQAITHYKVLKQHDCGVALVQCQLQTGRTHQIRVHMSEKGNSILGDALYGRSNRWKAIQDLSIQNLTKNLDRLALCAYELGFVHPVTKKELMFKIDVPENLTELINKLGFSELIK